MKIAIKTAQRGGFLVATRDLKAPVFPGSTAEPGAHPWLRHIL